MSSQETNAKNKQEQLKTKAFWIAFEMVFIFGLPAAGAVLLSNWQGWASSGLYILLAVAFVFSWVITIMRVRMLSADMKRLKKETQEKERKESNSKEN